MKIIPKYTPKWRQKRPNFKKKRVRRAERQFSEKSGFVLALPVYPWGAYVRNLRKNGEIPTFCAEKRRPEKNGGNLTRFSDFSLILVLFFALYGSEPHQKQFRWVSMTLKTN